MAADVPRRRAAADVPRRSVRIDVLRRNGAAGTWRRRVAAAVGLTLVVALSPTLGGTPAGAAPEVPRARPGAGPAHRPLPATVRPDKAVSPDKRPPVVPAPVVAGGEPTKVAAARWKTLADRDGPRVKAVPGAFSGLDLRSGFALGDTSLVAYFSATEVDPAWSAARVRLYDVESQTEQASTVVSRADLEAPRFCGGVGDFCRSFGAEQGWTLDPAREYFITIGAVFDDGREVVSDPSGSAKPRKTVIPPAIPDGLAAGCGCGNALALTAASQASRALGVNTGTGAFVRVEQDLSMASFGVEFASARTYSSLNKRIGPFGPGWAWSYDMRVIPAEDGGVVVRAEDGAEALYPAGEGGAYNRPAGVRSNLRKTDDGWELVTPRQLRYVFDGQGRLVSVRNARGKGVTLSYPDWGVAVTDASGRVTKAGVHEGLIRWVALPDGRTVRYGYTGGRLTRVVDARGFTWVYRYHESGLLAEVIDPYHVVTLRNEYGADGRVVSQKDGLGEATKFTWNAGEQEASTTDADGVTVWDGYRGNVLVYSQRATGDADNHRYDGRINRNLVVNGNQHQHEATFDGNGNRTSTTAPQGFSEKTKFDANNNPTEHIDANGKVWKDTYNEFNELVRSVDAQGHAVVHEYDERGLRTSTTDQRGKITRYEYLPAGSHNAGLLKAIVTPAGRRTEFAYDGTGRKIKTVDPRGTVPHANRRAYTTVYSYDAQDRTVAVREPGKREPWRNGYDAVGRTASRTTPAGVTSTYTYLPNGLLKLVKEGSRATAYTYTPAGRRASSRVLMHPAADLVTTYGYDGKGLLKTVTSPRGNVPGANPADFTSTYFYDANDNPIRLRRPYPGGTFVDRDIKVDPLDRTTGRVDELGKTSSFDRDNVGNVTGTTDALGRTTKMGYDDNGRQTEITDPSGKSVKTVYDEAGNKVKETSPTGGVTTWEYDDDGLLASMTEPRGNVAGVDKARFTTRFAYDLAGNRVKSIDPLGHATTYAYDANNRMVAVTDAKGRTTSYTYRDDDQPSTVHTPDAPWIPGLPTAGSTVFEYNDDGLPSAVRDQLGRATRMFYDRADRLVKRVDALGRKVDVGYDADGNSTTALATRPFERLSADERAERTIVNTYDIVGRLEKQTLGSKGPTYTFGYDAKDRTTSYGDPTGVHEVSYDDEDQIKTVTRRDAGRDEEVFSYGYDERGNVTSRSYPDGTKISSGYDEGSRITSLTARDGSAGDATATWSFGYDVADNRTSTTLPGPTGLVERRGYDDAGRLTSIGTERVGGTDPPAGVQDPISAFQLTLDEVGNPTRVVTTRGGVSESVAYGYDRVDRVVSACYAATACDPHSRAAGRIDYTYDLLGNRTSQKRSGTAGNDLTVYDYDAANQLTKQVVTGRRGPQVTTYGYDVNGNQTRAGDNRFTYNLDNTLASATVGAKTTRYAYDAARQRIAATTGEGDAATTRRWAWDVNGTLPQIAVDSVTNAAGQTTNRRAFAYGPDDEPLALLEPGVGAHSYTHDWLGGVANMLTPTGQNEAGYDYDPFGNPRTGPTLTRPADATGGSTAGPEQAGRSGTGSGRSGSDGAQTTAAVDNPLRYTGAYQDSSSGDGNYALRARNYNPGTGRFASVDPQPTSMAAVSPYAYATNNPLVYTDPTGEMPVADGGSAGTMPPVPGPDVPTGPSAEDMAKAQQLQSKSILDVVLEAGGQILMEVLGINDVLNCLKGDLGACVMAVVGSLPWGKIFKAKKIAEAIFRAGKAVIKFFKELEWAKAIMRGAERAAEAAKAAAAAAAEAAAKKAAAAKAAAEAHAKRVAAEAAERAKALAAKAKAKTKKGADSATDAAGGCAGKRHSFVTGTRVLLANGGSKSIEKVEPGDAVLASDPESGAGGAREEQVTHAIRTDDDKAYVDITVAAPATKAKAGSGATVRTVAGSTARRPGTSANGERDVAGAGRTKNTVTATAHHPFWSASRARWVDAGDVERGELLRTAAGTFVQVTAVRHYRGTQRTHDLTVNGPHTYFVIVGGTPILVHNNNCPTIDDDHIQRNHTPEGMFSTDKSKTEWLPETTPKSRRAIIEDVLDRGDTVTDTDNVEGIVKEFTYEEPIGYDRTRKRNPLYTMRVYYDPVANHVRNAFPVRR